MNQMRNVYEAKRKQARQALVYHQGSIIDVISMGGFAVVLNGILTFLDHRGSILQVAGDEREQARAANECFTWQQQGGGLRATPLDRESVRVE